MSDLYLVQANFGSSKLKRDVHWTGCCLFHITSNVFSGRSNASMYEHENLHPPYTTADRPRPTLPPLGDGEPSYKEVSPRPRTRTTSVHPTSSLRTGCRLGGNSEGQQQLVHEHGGAILRNDLVTPAPMDKLYFPSLCSSSENMSFS